MQHSHSHSHSTLPFGISIPFLTPPEYIHDDNYLLTDKEEKLAERCEEVLSILGVILPFVCLDSLEMLSQKAKSKKQNANIKTLGKQHTLGHLWQHFIDTFKRQYGYFNT